MVDKVTRRGFLKRLWAVVFAPVVAYLPKPERAADDSTAHLSRDGQEISEHGLDALRYSYGPATVKRYEAGMKVWKNHFVSMTSMGTLQPALPDDHIVGVALSDGHPGEKVNVLVKGVF